MMRRILAFLVLTLCTGFATLTAAQTTGDRIDLYFGDWHGAALHNDGALGKRDIFTRGDPHNPAQKAAVLRYANSYTYATLAPQAATKTARLEGQQEIYFVQSGRGTATAGGSPGIVSRSASWWQCD